MPKYAYKARDALGKQVEGLLEAADEKAVADSIARRGYFAISIKLQAESTRPSFISRLRGVSRRQLVMFSRQLATMVKAGVPLLSGLEILIQQLKDPTLSIVLREIRLDLNEGSSFTQALAKHPRVFSKLYVSTVRVGEETGNLEEVLDRLADFIEWEDSLRAAIIGSLLYPVIIMFVAVGVGIFLLTFVLPKFRDVYEKARVPLPGITRFMFGVSSIVTNYWYLFVAAAVGIVIGYILMKRSSAGRLKIDGLKLRIPLVREFVRKIAAIRFARSLEIMARSGVAVVASLNIIRQTMTNEVFVRTIDDITEEVERGRTVASALGDHPVFEPMLVQMVAVGEETGQLDDMLGFVGDAYEKQIDYLSKNLPKIIEPLLLIFVAGMVAVMALSLFLPIFGMMDAIKGL